MRTTVSFLALILLCIACSSKYGLKEYDGKLPAIVIENMNTTAMLSSKCTKNPYPDIFGDHIGAFFLERSEGMLPTDVGDMVVWGDRMYVTLSGELRLHDAHSGDLLTSIDKSVVSFDVDTISGNLVILYKDKITILDSTYNQLSSIAHDKSFEKLKLIDGNSALLTTPYYPESELYVVDLNKKNISPFRGNSMPSEKQKVYKRESLDPLYIFNRTANGLDVKYAFNDTVFNYTTTGRTPVMGFVSKNQIGTCSKPSQLRSRNFEVISMWRTGIHWFVQYRLKDRHVLVVYEPNLETIIYLKNFKSGPLAWRWDDDDRGIHLDGAGDLYMDTRNECFYSPHIFPEKGSDITEHGYSGELYGEEELDIWIRQLWNGSPKNVVKREGCIYIMYIRVK